MPTNDFSTIEIVKVLKLSPDIQIDLLKKFVDRTAVYAHNGNGSLALEDLLIIREEMLDDILIKVEEFLKTEACSIYIKDSPTQATLRAARGYQKPKIGKAVRKIVPSTEVKDKPEEDERLGLTSWVISTGRSFLAARPDDFLNHPHWSGQFDKHFGDEFYEKQKPITAFLAIPLRDSRGQVIGALKAQRFLPNESFSVENQITLEALGQIAGRCIAYVDDALTGPVNAAITSWALKIFSDASTTEGELDAFLDIVVRVSAAVSQAEACSVFLVDESSRTLTQRAGCGHQSLKNIIRSYSLPDRAQITGCTDFETCNPTTCRNKPDKPLDDDDRVGITAWVAATGKSFYANSKEELRQHCHHKGQFDPQNFDQLRNSEHLKGVKLTNPIYLEECSTWFGTPLVVGGTPIGVLKIENKTPIGKPDPRQFSTEVKQRLEILAQDISISIRRLQIQGKTRYAVINDAMPTILTVLQGGLDIPNLVERVVVQTASLFNARACALFLKEGNKLIQPKWAAYGYASQMGEQEGKDKKEGIREYDLVSKDSILSDPQTKRGLTVWIAVMQKKFYARSNRELKLHPHWKGMYDPVNFREEEQCESFMGVPLLVGEKQDLIGVLKVETKQRKVGDKTDYSYFNEQDALVFDLIANSVAIAIQNARLLASRRLADRLLAQSNRYNTLLEAFQFIEDRVDVLNTLEEATRNVAEKDVRKARILESVIGILKPDFNVTFLEQFADQISDSKDSNCVALTGLLKLIVKMIGIKSWTDLYKLQVNNFQTPDWFSRQFVLYKFVQTLLDVHRQISELLKTYDRDKYFTLALKNCISLLSEQIKDLGSQNLFIRNVLNRIFSRWKDLIETEFAQQHEIRNPYVAGKPLEANSTVFYGREEIVQWIDERLHDEKGILILHGGWHTGKTSILKQVLSGPLGERIRERNAILPVFVDLQGLADAGTSIFLLNLADRICSALQIAGLPTPVVVETDFQKAPYRAFDKFLSQVGQTIQNHNKQYLVLMLDEFEFLYERVKNNKLDPEIFQYLRSLMQHEAGVSFILAGRHRLDEMSLEVRTPIFNVAYHNEIGFLNPEEARRLIVEPVKPYAVEFEDPVVEKILKLTAGHPFFIQQLCRICIDLLNNRRQGYVVTGDILDEALKAALHDNVTLEDLWKREFDHNDREVVGELAEKIPLHGDTWVKESDLLKSCHSSPHVLIQSLHKPLIQKLILYRKMSSGEAEYTFGVDILRLWIKDQSLSSV